MINRSSNPVLANFRFRSIGPASMGGRIDDIAVVEQNPYIIYVAFATNGVWKSTNNGTTFEPVFDTYEVSSFGDLAIHPTNPDIVYAGSGEANNRQSSTYGGGLYKTTDGGKTWTLMGLRETQTIELWSACPAVSEDFEAAWRFITQRVDRLLETMKR